jgi:hypothetical protein
MSRIVVIEDMELEALIERTVRKVMSSPTPSEWLTGENSPWSARKFRQLCAAGAFPSAVKDGKAWRAKRSDVDTYLESLKRSQPVPSASTDPFQRALDEGRLRVMPGIRKR